MLSANQWITLTHTRGLGRKRLAKIAGALGRRSSTVSAASGLDETTLIRLGVPTERATHLLEALASREHFKPYSAEYEVVTPDHPDYPLARLSQALPPPVVLWAVGGTNLFTRPAVSIAGSRHASAEALAYAEKLGEAAAEAGLNVVTGWAAGIDRSAARGALHAGGSTTGVLAEGLTHGRAQLEGELGSVLWISEFEPETAWAGFRAMERNQTIAALADAVIVVAAGTSGGSWDQAMVCLKHGIALGVPDYPPHVAPGNRKLIERGAARLDPRAPGDALRAFLAKAQAPATLF